MKYNQSIIGSLLAGILLFILITGVVFADDLTPSPPNALLKVTVRIFSGRPNPVYYIEEQAAVNNFKSLFKKNQKNSGFKKDTVIPVRLGYTGIVVENLNDVADLPKKFVIYNNDIEIGEMGTTLKSAAVDKFLMDGSGQIESFLLDYGVSKNAFQKELRDAIKKDADK